MSLAPGVRLGAYEILAAIGAGGMGEVYRARDTRLGRDVAIKVLPEAFANEADRLARFKREAQVLASLNHPHIAAIYGLEETPGGSALVLELVEGPTLADRIAQGAIPLDEALPIATQIADALEAAHEHGIIHRDLKPANIKLTSDGTVKVLDFGLAKAVDTGSVRLQPDLSASPTITSPAMTMGGVILGTAAYMSPEQAKGKAVDRRTDIWAFGCVLFEMLTGTRAFVGDDVSDTLAEIIKGQPDWKALPRPTPHVIRKLLRRCLAKDRKTRLSDAAVVRLEIDELISGEPEAAGEPVVSTSSRRRYSAVAAVLGVLATSATAGVYIYFQPASNELPSVRYTLAPPEGTAWAPTSAPGSPSNSVLAVSPDGRHVVYTARATSGPSMLWIRSLDTVTPRLLQGTEGATSPFWSPDSASIGFFADSRLKKLDVSGGSAVPICDVAYGTGGTWGADGIIVFSTTSGALKKVSVAGGAPAAATTLVAAERVHAGPQFLPDGKRFLYLAFGIDASRQRLFHEFYVTSVDTPERTLIAKHDLGSLRYARGHLFFVRETTLFAQPFDEQRLAPAGDPAAIAEGIQLSAGRAPFFGVFSVSRNGVLAYLTGSTAGGSSLVWFDRSGKRLDVLSASGDYLDVELSSDRRAAVSEFNRSKSMDIQIFDLVRKVPTRLTFDPAHDHNMIWSPDGSRLVFNSTRKGAFDLYLKPATPAGTEELLLAGPTDKWPTSWSADGRLILYQTSASGTGIDLWTISPAEKKPVLYLRTPFAETQGRFSPDGRWVAYQSNMTGQQEVYVSPFPAAATTDRISTGGGFWPRWRADGKEIFYLSSENQLIAVAVDGSGKAFHVGEAKPLFAPPLRSDYYRFYDVTTDGQRFLINAANEDRSASLLTMIVNWPASVRK